MKLSRKSFYPLTILLMLSACDSFLSENPDNRVDLDTAEKAAQLLTSAYPSAAYTFTEWMADEVSYTQGTTKRPEHVQAYNWEESTSSNNQDTPSFIWAGSYEAIAPANEVLAIIDEMEGDADLKSAIRGEALLARAYGHFMLVNLFAKHYNRQTATTDAGVPYVEEPETVFIKQYARNTVAEVYDKVERDLREGMRLVDGRFYKNSGKYHFTSTAALALASRFYLFKGDFENCINYSTEMLGSNPDIFIKDLPTILADYTNTEEFLRLMTSPSDNSNLLLARQVTNYPINVGFWPSIDQVNSLYDNNPWNAEDLRRSNRYPLFIRGTDGYALAKYQFLFERTSITSNVGYNYTIMPLFRGEEVLLNRAEAYASTGQNSAALADLQIYVDKRYTEKPRVTLPFLQNYYRTNNAQAALMAFIVDERDKEFIHEGLRWFDIKRFNLPVTHITQTGASITLGETDLRKVLQIPQNAIDVGGLEPNPR
ncbi:MAG TPA: RagB/SusD family nutrient uptake outer membrane protein [Chryseolinea sp.]|nr:RagB/SusD family nutrient uptake outer membrane protein [Chryseolinea sp.]